MKKLFFLSFSAIILIAPSCTKEEEKQTTQSNSYLKKISQYFDLEDQKDFTVLTSSSTPAGLFSAFDLEKTSTTIQAASMDETYEGSFYVNGQDIPFTGPAYHLQSDSAFTASNIIGATNNYVLDNAASVSNFSKDMYCPEQTDLNYTGLLNERMPKDGSVMVTWSPDPNLPANSKAAIVLYSDNASTDQEITSLFYEVSDSDGEFTLDASQLSEVFQDRITLLYLRGYRQVENISGSEIDFQFLGQTWTTLLFEE